MQVRIAVRYFAQTAAVVFTHHLTAVLCSCRHVKQVPAQCSLKIHIQGEAAGLRRGGDKCDKLLKPKTFNTELLHP